VHNNIYISYSLYKFAFYMSLWYNICMMVHYSSCTVYYEGGAKNPLKGTSLKFLVNAQNAQLCVVSGRKEIRVRYNGI
jgi:hypothetical protein